MEAPQVSPLRERLKNVKPYSSEIVAVPEWGESVEVRSMSVGRRNDMVARATVNGEVDNAVLYPELVIACAFDPDAGVPLFSESDRGWIVDQDATAVDRIALAAMRISGMDMAGAVDEGKGAS